MSNTSASLMTTQRKSSTIANNIRRRYRPVRRKQNQCASLSAGGCRHITHAVNKVNNRLTDALTSTSSLTTLASARGNSSAARRCQCPYLMSRGSPPSQHHATKQTGIRMPLRLLQTIRPGFGKHSHDFWLVIPRLAIHFSGSIHQPY